MADIVNDFTVNIATANGTGSQSANLILLHSMFEMGVPVSGKNLFPSNISGPRYVAGEEILPTYRYTHFEHRMKQNQVCRLRPCSICSCDIDCEIVDDICHRLRSPGGSVGTYGMLAQRGPC